MTSNGLPPKQLVQTCRVSCSWHPDKIGLPAANTLMALRASGAGVRVMSRKAEELTGKPVNLSSMTRHIRHYREADPDPDVADLNGPKLGDLDILDRIIQQGARNSRSWKPSIKDTIEAMKLKMQITGNSAFDDMLRAMEQGLQVAEGASEDDFEAPEALYEEGERSEDEEVADPVL